MCRIKIAILAEFPIGALTSGALGRGGGQGCTWLPQLALAFEKHQELEIHWVVLDRTIRKTIVMQAHGQWFHRVPAVKMSIDLALHCLPARWLLGREVRRIRPDVVHAWGAELLYPAALQDFNGPTIFSMQGSLTEYQRIGGLPNDWRWKRMVVAEPNYVNTATVVTAESPWAAERVRELKPSADCRIVDYGVHPTFDAMQWKPDPEQPYALYVGGGGYRKGTDVLLESLSLLKDQQWKVKFAGDDALAKEVANASLPNAEYLGMLNWKDLLEVLSKAWCLVVPTRGDTGPTVVKEARAVGLPIVGTVHGGLRDYIRNGETGIVVNPLNAEALAGALQYMMASHEKALQMGKSHHQEDRERFSSRLTAKRFADIYQSLVAQA